MLRSDFDYELPEELIAQEPATERDESRLLVLNRARGCWNDHTFADLPSFVTTGDVIVLNNTRVFPARLVGYRLVGGTRSAQIEALLLRCANEKENEWEILAKPGRAFKPGAELEFGDGQLRGVVTAQLEEGRRLIRFKCSGNIETIVDEIGSTPLPPYIKRQHKVRVDESRYQTIYASQRGAIAAPTAGLHFTPHLLEKLRMQGVEIVEITHHVGYATFQPIRVEQIEEHKIDTESYEISPLAANAINQARDAGKRIIAVGTTTARALESATAESGQVRAEQRTTNLFIYPGYRFRAIDSLITNFHLPQSSLLMLVSAFAGRELTLQAYRYAVTERYRFYSYGDSMLIL